MTFSCLNPKSQRYTLFDACRQLPSAVYRLTHDISSLKAIRIVFSTKSRYYALFYFTFNLTGICTAWLYLTRK